MHTALPNRSGLWALVIAVIVAAIGRPVVGLAEGPAADESARTVAGPQLTGDIKSATAGSASDRCEALKRMGDYWSPKRAAARGFTDLPVETPQPSAPTIRADDIEAIAMVLQAAGQHDQTLLHACIRACGGEVGEVVHLSQDVPVAFKPKSAWPGVDPRRRSDALGHGDGFVEILVTGELKFADGGHPAKVQFLRTNDSMLLGESRNEPMPLKYDAATGRFVLRTSVFAAYDVGKPPEPGPYKTGSAQVRIESPGSVPLVVQFFDEMPHVVIELPRH